MSCQNEGFQKYGAGVFMHQTIFDIVMETIVKSIEEGLVIARNVGLKTAKLGGIG